MNEYIVTWQISVDASSHKEAAEEAQRIQRDTESTATFFNVTKADGIGRGSKQSVRLGGGNLASNKINEGD